MNLRGRTILATLDVRGDPRRPLHQLGAPFARSIDVGAGDTGVLTAQDTA